MILKKESYSNALQIKPMKLEVYFFLTTKQVVVLILMMWEGFVALQQNKCTQIEIKIILFVFTSS